MRCGAGVAVPSIGTAREKRGFGGLSLIRYPLAVPCSYGSALPWRGARIRPRKKAESRFGRLLLLAPAVEHAAIPNAAAVCGRGRFCVSPPQGRSLKPLFVLWSWSVWWRLLPIQGACIPS